MSKSIVKVENLSHRYSVQWAVRDINFEISQTGIVGLLGSNGAGKSNIIKAIHFLQGAVRSGEILPNMSRFKYKLDPEIAARPIVFDIEYEWHKKFYGYHLEILNDIISLIKINTFLYNRLLMSKIII